MHRSERSSTLPERLASGLRAPGALRARAQKPAWNGHFLGVELVASGQAEIGIYPASEVVEVKGVTIVGPLPKGIDLTILYGGAAMTGTSQAAADFVKFMAAPEHRSDWTHAGFVPPVD